MSLPIVINPVAEEDLAEAQRFYNGRRPGLGADFLLCVEEALDAIRRFPEAYAKEFQDLRRKLVRRFPYAVIYRIDDDQITVVAVYDCRRNPRGWQRRA
jgi:plasmid stabilization system protein ParE